MKKCLKCGAECNDSAKFCRSCGAPFNHIEAGSTTTKICPQCSTTINITSKFCKICGYHFEEKVSDPQNESIAVRNHYITWHVLPGQLAVKITEEDIDNYGTVLGLCVSPGTKALVFEGGRFIASLESGTYAFKQLKAEDFDPNDPNNKKASLGFFRNLFNYISTSVSNFVGNRQAYTIVLVKGTEFPLIYSFESILTKRLPCKVGLHTLCKIENLNAFFAAQLSDCKYVTIESFAKHVITAFKETVTYILKNYEPNEIDNNPALNAQLLDELKKALGNVYSYVSLTQIIKLSASHEGLSEIHAQMGQLYIDEMQLKQTHLRNEFTNRLQNEEYEHELRMARSEVEYQALMDKVNRDKLANDDEMHRYVLALSAERELREATTQVELENGIRKLEQSRMLSQEEIDQLQRAITHRANMEKLENGQALAMATLQNNAALKNEQLKWDIALGKQKLQAEMEERKIKDDYADIRREIDAQFTDSRRQSDLDFKKQEAQNDLDIMHQLVEMQQAREDAKHKRELDIIQLNLEGEKQRLQTQIEITKIYAGMGAEEIMAANPNISPAAAKAFEEKFKAEAAMAQNSKTEELYKQHMEQIMQMAQFSMNTLSGAKDRELVNKQEELNRMHQDAERHQDRMLSGVQVTASAMAGAIHQAPQPQTVIQNSASVFCPECGKQNDPNAIACKFCGKTM